MALRTITWCAGVCLALGLAASSAEAQIVESVGERALGMGGAFVAVANDSSATWWNPGALAAGPFIDVGLVRTVDEHRDTLPARRERVSGFALTTPPFGFSFYRLRLSAVPVSSAEIEHGGRLEGQLTLPLQAWSASQVGATLVQTIAPGTHVGATVKYVRGTFRTGNDATSLGASTLLDRAGDLGSGTAEGQFDVDLGALATAGPVRLGALVRNVRGSRFADGAFELPRQARVGFAIDAEKSGGIPLTVSLDADVRAYQTAAGPRRVIAVGAEQWLAGKRLALRGGARFDREGDRERALTGGGSVSLRTGMFLEAHVVRGGSPGERGWGVAARVSF